MSVISGADPRPAEGVEPNLGQFEPARCSFPDEATQLKYTAATEELRDVMRRVGNSDLRVRLLGQPTIEMVRHITQTISDAAERRPSAQSPHAGR